MPQWMGQTPAVPEGWRVQGVRTHRTFGHWGEFAANALLALTGSAPNRSAEPDVTYSLRKDADGTIREIRLSGDHSHDALVEAMHKRG